ncbi:ABC transporter substrate-binding protein [Rhodococcus gannanensis]|uniref:ABC transporter substrate-binding protein n=1 Tax=Rhodococcus gannanensis TaxID=1960308 RepID=A0ABW4NZV7_9NOCA
MRVLRSVAVATLGAVAVLVAGCGENDASESAGEPVTVEHTYGTTTVDGTPTRIVAGTSQWVDALLEFGIQPVAYHSAAERGDERGLFPWQSDVATDAVELEASATAMSLPVEQIAAQNPDLILGSYTVTSQSDFDKLSQIAPTLPALGDAQVDQWEEQVAVLGDILGQPERADQIIADANAEIDALADRLPGLQGKTAALAQYMFSTNQIIVVADPDDGASSVFERLGMSVPQALVDEAGATGGRLTLSPERVDALTADLVVMLPNGGTAEQLNALPGFADLPAVREGGLAVVDYPTVVGFNTPSATSVLYSLDRITPQLEAVAG